MAKNTLLNQVRNLRGEGEAYEFLETLRWHGKPECRHCGSKRVFYLTPKGEGRKTRTGKVSERRVWKCGACRKQFSAITGTIFHGTKVELRIWLAVVVEMCANKNGMAAREIERKYGVAPKTAWHMAHRIREGMKARSPEHLLTGTFVADEAYFGGDPKNRHGGKNAVGGRGTSKTPVFTLIDAERGEARSRVIANVDGNTLGSAIREVVDPSGSMLWTDKWAGYGPVGREFAKHIALDHDGGEYVRDGGGTNLAENFFSQLKRSIDGTHHKVSVEHLPRYLSEFDFRYSTCKMSDTERVDRLMGQVGGRRLTYKRVRG